MEPSITLYRGTEAPGVIFEIQGAELSGGTIEMEVRWRRAGGPLSTMSFSTADGGIELVGQNHISWRPAGQVTAALPDLGAVGDFFQSSEGRREKLAAFTVRVLGAGEYEGATQLVALGPVLQGAKGETGAAGPQGIPGVPSDITIIDLAASRAVAVTDKASLLRNPDATARSLTFGLDLPVGFWTTGIQRGSGAVTLVAGSGVTFFPSGGGTVTLGAGAAWAATVMTNTGSAAEVWLRGDLQ